MGSIQGLWLLVAKDFRCMARNKISLIVELIIVGIVLAILGVSLYMLGKGDKSKPLDDTTVDYENLIYDFKVKMLGRDRDHVFPALKNACPSSTFEDAPTHPSPDLVVNTFNSNPPGLNYEVIVYDTKSFGLPSKSMQGNIFGDGEEKYKLDISGVKKQTLYLQHCINRAYARRIEHAVPLIKVGNLPLPPIPAPFYENMGGTLTYLALIVVVLALKEVAAEKLNGVHAYLLAVGLPRYTFLASHFIFAFAKIVIVVVVVAIVVIVALGVFPSLKIALAFFLFANAILAFALIIAAICQRSLFVVMAAVAYVIVGNVITMVLKLSCFAPTRALIFSIAHPCCAFSMIMNHYDISLKYKQPVKIFTDFGYYLPVGYPFIALIGHFVLFMIITFYIDYALPTDDTPKLHPLFFLGLGKKEETDSENEAEKYGSKQKDNCRHEEIQATGELQLEVKDLVKKWPNGDTAVNKISFKVHSGQVVALLGHNGAGKSTTFSCLTGFLKPTSGTIKLVNGGRVGYCPQWDPLFPNLTVKEHLVFYSKLFTGKSPDAEVMDATLEKIELDKAAGTLSKNLSGGMKRKLSLGIALISDAKVILLDEPTAGIDTFARRNMVKVIEKAKSDHAVVITTHYMDEADALSDHINIMAHGEIICSGSSEFLKSKFGTGIMLVVDLALSHNEHMDIITRSATAILDVVRKSCPDAEFYGPIAKQLNIIIHSKHRPAFPYLFEELENKSPYLNIESFDVTLNSLDQVFVNVTKEAEGVKEVKPDVEVMKFIQKRKQFNLGGRLFLKQMYALLIRKIHNFRRDYLQITVALIAFLLILVTVVEKKTRGKEDHSNVNKEDYRDLDPKKYFAFNTKIFATGKNHNLKLKMNRLLEYHHLQSTHQFDGTDQQIYDQMIGLRWSIPTPTIYYGFTDNVAYVLTNPGFKHGEYVAQQMFYESFYAGSITGKITYKPTPDPSNDKSERKEYIKSNLLLGLIFLLAYPLIFALPVFLYTTERVEGAVHLYARTHLTKITYWATAFLSELVALFVFSAVVAIVLFSTSFYHISCLGPFLLFTFLLSFAFIAQAYAASQLFNSSGITFTLLMVWNIVLFLILFMIIESLKKQFYPVTYLTFLMPSLAMFQLFMSVHIQCYRSVSFDDLLKHDSDNLHPFVLIGGTTAIHAALLIGVLLYPRIAALFVKANNNTSTQTDTLDIKKERERVKNSGIGSYAIVALGLKKVFGYPWNRKTAVHNVTFGVGKNECFGLLGSNGAGKSTTFNMLTASLRPTAGKAYVGGTSVANSPEFGFCPQKESILMELTVHETLLLFARLSGINETHEVAKLVMNCLQLTARKDVLVRRCSGGEKRRVSIGVALITDPNILMLDEPTAGVDPHTRRFVWETLLTLKNTGASMILTSHSMEECEALCTRIAFLTGGNMIALGTSQHLKHTLGNEYVLTVSLNGANPALFDDLDKRIKQVFEATGDNEPNDINLRWTFQKKGQRMSVLYAWLDQIVAEIESAHAPFSQTNLLEPVIRECLIVGATLEDVFVKLAQQNTPTTA